MKRILPFALLAATVVSNAEASSCAASYAGGAAPKVVNAKMQAKTRELCYEGYATPFPG
jgi:endonuclease G